MSKTDEMEWEAPPPMGGNFPPEPLDVEVVAEPKRSQAEMIADHLKAEYATDLALWADLQAKVDSLELPITDEAGLARVADLITSLNALGRKLDKDRLAENVPYNEMIRAVNGWFEGMLGPIRKLTDTKNGRLKKEQTRYLLAKEAIAREAARKEAADRKAEAEKLAEEAALRAKHAETDEERQHAQSTAEVATEVAKMATTATAQAQAPAAEHARTRTTMGSLATLVETLDFEIDRETVDLEKLRPFFADTAIHAAVEQYKRLNRGAIDRLTRDEESGGYKSLPGVRFFISKHSRN